MNCTNQQKNNKWRLIILLTVLAFGIATPACKKEDEVKPQAKNDEVFADDNNVNWYRWHNCECQYQEQSRYPTPSNNWSSTSKPSACSDWRSSPCD